MASDNLRKSICCCLLHGYEFFDAFMKEMMDIGLILFVVMNQPPWDIEVGDKYIIHYTYGCDYDMKVRFQILIMVYEQ